MTAYLAPLPLFIGFLAIIIGKKEHASKIAIASAFIALLISLSGVFLRTDISTEWFVTGPLGFEFGFQLDALSMFMLPLVAFITTLVFIYSTEYLEGKEDLKRYYACMSLFALSMMLIILSNNLLMMFFAWELVGLSSYLLIGFWYEKKSASKAMRKAFTIITIGDIAIFAGMAILLGTFGTLNFEAINNANTPAALGALLLLIGAFSKSAQFPLHVWLPDAMEGPTPVSALLHSATMVKAGIYLMARIYPLLQTSGLLPILAWVGMISILLSATLALAENDVKRILAYSSISHLGFMTFGLGVGAYNAALFHMFNHSFFKAMLFLIAGILIHQSHSQDIQKIFFGDRKLALVALIGVLALSGVPPFNGFWSKDQIIEAASHNSVSPIFYPLILGATFLSALYIFRWFMVPYKNSGHAHFGNRMFLPVALLSIFALTTGFLMNPFYEWFHGEAEFQIAGAIPSGAMILIAFVLAYMVYWKGMIKSDAFISNPLGGFVHKALVNRYWIDVLYEKIFAAFIVTLSGVTHKFDTVFIDGLVNGAGKAGILLGKVSGLADMHVVDGAVNGIGDVLKMWGEMFRRLVTGFVQTYMAWVMGGILLLIFFLRYVTI